MCMLIDKNETRKPTIVLPYMESNLAPNEKDLFIYLRPETNGIAVEAILFGVIHNSELYRNGSNLVYLANLPGDFLTENEVIERHYSLKCKMAREGRACFTDAMISGFEKWYKVKWDDVKVISAYNALDQLGITSRELFELWVKDQDFYYIHGQSIKKIGDMYVINYDIPELLKKNRVDTDLAVMVLRTSLSNRDLTSLITDMEEALKDGGAIDPNTPPRRCFHYTKSPLEEILDGLGYLYNEKGEPKDLSSISFASYLMKKGLNEERIRYLVENPIVIMNEGGHEREVYLYDYLLGDSYDEAYEKISNIVKQEREVK